MRDHVLLSLNGKRHEVRGAQVFQSLSDFLRQTQRLTATKVVCAEGDCGSCTVLLGRADDAGELRYQPVTSCIQYVAQLDGVHVITAEGVRTQERLHPVQQAMIDLHGAQCGYCTPGMVTSLCALFEGRTAPPTRAETTRALVGNLCRCTGYDSILAAAEKVDMGEVQPLAERYSSAEMRRELHAANEQSVHIIDGERHLLKPATLADALKWRKEFPTATVLAGGTDLGVVWNKGKRELKSLLCIGNVRDLRIAEITADGIVLGAAATITEFENITADALPEYARMLERFGSPPIKNAGTIGGNLANGSPIGDSMPGLFVLDAEVELNSMSGSRRVNINDFYTGYRKNVMRPDELLTRVIMPLPREDELFFVEKISKRRDLDISSFAAAIWLKLEGAMIRRVRIAYGGVAPTIVRLPKTEQFLAGQDLSEDVFRAAAQMARAEVKPISDVRGSAEYRSTLAANVLVKFGRRAMEQLAVAGNGHK